MRRRFREFLRHQGITPHKAEEMCQFSNGTLHKYLSGKNIGSDKIERIGLVFNQLNVHWWITGVGEMLLDETPWRVEDDANPYQSGSKNDPKHAFVSWMTNIEQKVSKMEKQLSKLAPAGE